MKNKVILFPVEDVKRRRKAAIRWKYVAFILLLVILIESLLIYT